MCPKPTAGSPLSQRRLPPAPSCCRSLSVELARNVVCRAGCTRTALFFRSCPAESWSCRLAVIDSRVAQSKWSLVSESPRENGNTNAAHLQETNANTQSVSGGYSNLLHSQNSLMAASMADHQWSLGITVHMLSQIIQTHLQSLFSAQYCHGT